ncbi:MAG: MmgE/PrpD family protein, partial [Ignavibacteriae bacterium]|nr:MmgE/PrpD family protein [Ignavibacteriota bacterium]
MRKATSVLAEFAAETRYDDIPEEVIHETKRLFLDTIGCIIAGSVTEKGRLVRDVMAKLGGRPESTVIGEGSRRRNRTSCTNAAFVNAEFGNALDLDETFLFLAHLGSIVVPASLAISEVKRSGGKDVIAAIALGYEIACRVSLSTGIAKTGSDYRPSFAPSIFSASVSAGRLLELDKAQMQNDIGTAGFFAPLPGFVKYSKHLDVPMIKSDPYGWIAQGGVTAALLAKNGYTGYLDILDGENGFWKMQGYSSCDYDLMLGGLGKKWWMRRLSYKPYPCCRVFHAALDALYQIKREENLDSNRIESITVRLPHSISRFNNSNPRTPIETEFSLPHAISAAAIGLGLTDWNTSKTMNDERVKRLRKKVRVITDPSLGEVMRYDTNYAGWPSSIEVRSGGVTHKEARTSAKGEQANNERTMDDSDLREKFGVFTGP